MVVGGVCLLPDYRAELRPRPAAAQSMPRPLKMSTKFREIVLNRKYIDTFIQIIEVP